MANSDKVKLAHDWIATWNAILAKEKTLDDLVAFYSMAVLYDSPYTKELTKSDRITNTSQLKNYFIAGLQKYEAHPLTLRQVFAGDKYLNIIYTGFDDRLTSEFILLDNDNKFLKVYVSYAVEL
jgi:hypothetical protein